MNPYTDFTKHFGNSLKAPDFSNFLAEIFTDLTEYDILQSEYILSVKTGIELGFKNEDAEYDDDDIIIFKKGTPIFSHFNLFPKSESIISSFPFDIKFSDTRNMLHKKIGEPLKTVYLQDKLFNKTFLIDHYKLGDIAISIDYDSETETINHIQIRDNNLVIDELKL